MISKLILFTVVVVLVTGFTGINFNMLYQELVQVCTTKLVSDSLVQYAFGAYADNPDRRNKGFYDNVTKTELVFDGSTLTINQNVEKSEYKSGERIWVERELINNSNKTLGISYTTYGIFETYFINQANGVVMPKYGSYTTLLEGNEGVTIKPGSYTLDNTTGNKSFVYPPRQTFSFVIDTPGNYTVITGASLGVYDNVTHLSDSYVWSKPLQVTVLPEKYIVNKTDSSLTKIPEFPFAVPILLVSIVSILAFYRFNLNLRMN